MKPDSRNETRDALLSAAVAARRELGSLRAQVAELRMQRERLLAAPITRADFVATMVRSLDVHAKRFLTQKLEGLRRHPLSYATTAAADSFDFTHLPTSVGPSSTPELTPGAIAFFMRDIVEQGVERMADAMEWSDSAIPVADRPALLSAIDEKIGRAAEGVASIEEALGMADKGG